MANVYSVSQVNKYIKALISEDFFLKRIYVKGEVSNCKYHSSGHIYFTLKDREGAMACVMFAGSRGGLKFRLEEGQSVTVLGSVNVYERDGRYQLYAKEIIKEGKGDLYSQFEALKQELGEKGYFSEAHKKAIPLYPNKIGIVTASTGAAIQDMIRISGRRNPYVQLILYPALVQGEQAADSIVKGIRYLDETDVDVIIIGRGGGSIEDLWAFNEKKVADAVYRCKKPIISAVGHETDVTISDFTADLRAATPSAAAEIAVPKIEDIESRIEERRQRLMRTMEERLDRYRSFIEQYKMKLQIFSPEKRLNDYRQRLMGDEEKLMYLLKEQIRVERSRLSLYSEKLNGLSPLKQLERGYAVVSDEGQKMITSVEKIETGSVLNIQFLDGDLEVVVSKKHLRGREESGQRKNT